MGTYIHREPLPDTSLWDLLQCLAGAANCFCCLYCLGGEAVCDRGTAPASAETAACLELLGYPHGKRRLRSSVFNWSSVSAMRVFRLMTQVINLLFLTEWTLCGMVGRVSAPPSGGQLPPHRRRLLEDAGGGPSRDAEGSSSRDARTERPGVHPVGIPHMWSERQHQKTHANDGHVGGRRDGNPGGSANHQDPTGEAHTVTFDHVQEGASHIGKPAVTRQYKEQLKPHQLQRTGINDILKRPGVDPEITGDANNLNLLSVMRLAKLNISEFISDAERANLTDRQLRRKLRRRLSQEEARRQKHGGRSRYSLVTTRVRTRAKRSDADLNDDYTWAVIVGGSGLAILIIVMCACVCARCNVDRKNTELAAPLPAENPPTPAVFFVGGNHSADTSGPTTSGVDNSAFAMGDLPMGAEGGAVGGVHRSDSGFGYSALKDDDDCVSLRSATLELEKS